MSHYVPSNRFAPNAPEDWERNGRGATTPSVDAEAFARVWTALSDIVSAAEHTETVAVFSHGGVINGAARDPRTANLLSFPIDYASVTICATRAEEPSPWPESTESSMWDLLPRNRPRRDH